LLAPVSFTHALHLSLCLAGLDHQPPSHCPAHPFLLSLRCGPALSVPPPPRSPLTGACALAHVADFSATTPAHAPSSILRAPPVPRAHPSPHFAQLHPLSRSTHTASRHRRPAPAFPAIQLVGDRSKPPRAPPRRETPVPVPDFPYCALCSANFAFAGARPRRSTVLAWWPADLARSSSPE
jgi:hypothetical protein